jgi:hypothetical protein
MPGLAYFGAAARFSPQGDEETGFTVNRPGGEFDKC